MVCNTSDTLVVPNQESSDSSSLNYSCLFCNVLLLQPAALFLGRSVGPSLSLLASFGPIACGIGKAYQARSLEIRFSLLGFTFRQSSHTTIASI